MPFVFKAVVNAVAPREHCRRHLPAEIITKFAAGIEVANRSCDIQKAFVVPRYWFTLLAVPAESNAFAVPDLHSEPEILRSNNTYKRCAVSGLNLFSLFVICSCLVRNSRKFLSAERFGGGILLRKRIPARNNAANEPEHLLLCLFFCFAGIERIRKIFRSVLQKRLILG